jgi:hypothetical protein
MKSKFFKMSFYFLPLIMSISSCSDFRKAVGKEKVIPDEFLVLTTPSLLVPPGYNIDPEVFKNKNVLGNKDFNLSEKIEINDKNNISSFKEIFISKDIPKDIRKIVDEETLGISLSERRGIDILFGNVPRSGVVLEGKKEALRLRSNKLSGEKINSSPTPALDINSGKSIVIK